MEWLTKLSAAQRIDMKMKGLNPLVKEEVKEYLDGSSLSLKEREERVKTLVGNAVNLGGANEREFTPEVGREFSSIEEIAPAISKKNQNNEKLLRESLNQEMDSYVTSAARTFDTSDILPLKQNSVKENKNTSNQFFQEGYTNAKNYLNAFTINLQTSDLQNSYNLRLKIFKALKVCLEGENKYKDSPKRQQEYRRGVLAAEKALLSKL